MVRWDRGGTCAVDISSLCVCVRACMHVCAYLSVYEVLEAHCCTLRDCRVKLSNRKAVEFFHCKDLLLMSKKLIATLFNVGELIVSKYVQLSITTDCRTATDCDQFIN